MSQATGVGIRERDVISKVNGNAFKHKQMKHPSSRIMTGMDVEISVIPLRILMANSCQASVVDEGQRLSGNCFHLQGLRDLIPPWLGQPTSL